MMISIIVPKIGRKSISETLESLVSQTNLDFEIIVTDDTEEQRGKSIVDEIQHSNSDIKIRYSVNEKYFRGPCDNRNNGLDLAAGDYITFVDHDTLMPHALVLYK